MADNFGIKLGIDGEKAFKQALRDINANFKELGSEMKLATSQFEKNDKSVEALAARNTVLTKTITEQQNKIETLRKALKNAEESFGENDKRTQQWRIQLNNAEAELNNMERELKQNTEEVKDNSQAVEDSDSKWSGLGKTVKVAAAAIAAAWAAASAAAVQAGKALVQMTIDGAKYADEILTDSKVTGIATDTLQEYKYAAELVDVSVETLTGALTKTIKSMSSAAKGSGDAAKAYEKLGISVTDTNGELRDNEEVFWDIVDALGQVDNETERDSMAMTLLGKSAQELNPLIEAGSDRMRELGEEARNSGFVLSGDALEAYAEFDDAVQRLKNSVTAAKNALGQILLPSLEKLASAGVTALGKLTKGLSEANGDLTQIGDTVSEALPGFLSMVYELVPELLEVISSAVLSVAKILADNLPSLISQVISIAKRVLDALVSMLPQVAKSVIQLVAGVARTISENAGTIVNAVASTLNIIIVEIARALPEITDSVITTIEAAAFALIDNMPLLIEAVMELVASVLTTVMDNLPRLIRLITDVVVAITKQTPAIIKIIVSNLDTIIETVLSGIMDALPELISCVNLIAIELVKATPLIISELIKAIPMIVEALVTSLLDPKNQAMMISAGVGMMVSLAKGMWDTLKSFGQMIVDFFVSLWDTIKGIFGAFGKFFNFGNAKIELSEIVNYSGLDQFAGLFGGNNNGYNAPRAQTVTVNIENYVQNSGEDIDEFTDRIMTAAERRALRMGAMAY